MTPVERSAAGGPSGPGLIAAVAGIVAVAAERARAAGDLGALRAAINGALEPANDTPQD